MGSEMGASEVRRCDVNELILREVNAFYKGGKGENMSKIAEVFGQECIPPRRRVHIMIIGNHSAGKSSFINWYMGADCLKTGVAIESQGFSLVTQGKRWETLKGEATLDCFEYLRALQKHPGFVENLRTEIIDTTSQNKELVTFVDTPGLTDGATEYGFSVEDVIVDLADRMDLIFVFFDPLGQTLCSRTMRVLERLNENYRDKIRLYLSKADTVKNSEDRYKVVFQIAQGLTAVKNHASKLPMIYLPTLVTLNEQEKKELDTLNGLNDACAEINKAIDLGVQDALNQVLDDTDAVLKSVDDHAKHNEEVKKYNKMMRNKHMLFAIIGFFCILYPAAVLFSTVIDALPESTPEKLFIEIQQTDTLGRLFFQFSYHAITASAKVGALHKGAPILLYACITIFATMAVLIRYTTQRKHFTDPKEADNLERFRSQIVAIKKRRSQLYAMYISQSLTPDFPETTADNKPEPEKA